MTCIVCIKNIISLSKTLLDISPQGYQRLEAGKFGRSRRVVLHMAYLEPGNHRWTTGPPSRTSMDLLNVRNVR